MRVAYPDVVHGALAASAPLRYHAGTLKGGEFFEVRCHSLTFQDACIYLFLLFLRSEKFPFIIVLILFFSSYVSLCRCFFFSYSISL
jgi:hypothetical protein